MNPHVDDTIPAQNPDHPEPLLTVESQHETDAFTGRTTERLFVKMYISARTSGLLAAISDRDWKTLCVLATYVDSDGYCYPSQEELARALGCSRSTVNERIQSLLRFEFRGQRVLLLEKRVRHLGSGRWASNAYRLPSIASLQFGRNNGSAAPDVPSDIRSNQTDGGMLQPVHQYNANMSLSGEGSETPSDTYTNQDDVGMLQQAGHYNANLSLSGEGFETPQNRPKSTVSRNLDTVKHDCEIADFWPSNHA